LCSEKETFSPTFYFIEGTYSKMSDSETKQYLDELVETIIAAHNITREEAEDLIKRSDTEKLLREDAEFASHASVSFWAEMCYILHKKQ